MLSRWLVWNAHGHCRSRLAARTCFTRLVALEFSASGGLFSECGLGNVCSCSRCAFTLVVLRCAAALVLCRDLFQDPRGVWQRRAVCAEHVAPGSSVTRKLPLRHDVPFAGNRSGIPALLTQELCFSNSEPLCCSSLGVTQPNF